MARADELKSESGIPAKVKVKVRSPCCMQNGLAWWLADSAYVVMEEIIVHTE
jgi:hypothetical protein